jgi:DNA helicase-2/ATP-dependent DNA helicase PcrA
MLQDLKEQLSISELINEILKRTGYLRELEEEDSVEAQSRIENLKEFISVGLEYQKQNEDADLSAFLENISLVSDIDTYEEGQDAVVFMTLHSAKGLEFRVVFLVGMEEGVFPSFRSISESNELEEERRLCYVGITRAREKLYMLRTNSRTLFGSTTYNRCSRFISEIPEELFEEGNLKQNLAKKMPQKASLAWKSNFNNTVFAQQMLPKEAIEMNFAAGDKVEHKKFGVGIISKIEPEADDFKVEILFEESGMKRLMARFANLTKIEE